MRLFLLILMFFQSIISFSQINRIGLVNNPKFRLKSKIEYDSKNLGVPKELSSNTVNISSKTNYEYDNLGRIIRIITSYYPLNNGISSDNPRIENIEKINYLKKRVIKRENSSWTYFKGIRMPVSNNKIIKIQKNGVKRISIIGKEAGEKIKIIVKTRFGKIRKVKLYSDDRKESSKVKYDSLGRVQKIWNMEFHYLQGQNYYTYSSGALTSMTYYYFNKEGYLIRKIYETDTNPTIIIYEYERGKGNASSIVYSIYDLFRLTPTLN